MRCNWLFFNFLLIVSIESVSKFMSPLSSSSEFTRRSNGDPVFIVRLVLLNSGGMPLSVGLAWYNSPWMTAASGVLMLLRSNLTAKLAASTFLRCGSMRVLSRRQRFS